LTTDNPISRLSNDTQGNSKRQATPTPFSQITDVPLEPTNRPNTTGLTSPTGLTQFNYDDHWQEVAIDLQRVNNREKNSFFSLINQFLIQLAP
jgi:hypothetical protein